MRWAISHQSPPLVMPMVSGRRLRRGRKCERVPSGTETFDRYKPVRPTGMRWSCCVEDAWLSRL